MNRDGILLYWDIGRAIVEKQRVRGWGDAVVEMVSADLRRAFPQMKGFSPRNVWDMRRLYETYSASEFLGQAVPKVAGGASTPILRQLVAELAPGKKWPQPVAKLTSSTGMAAYQLRSKLPADLRGKLPTAKQLADVVRSVLPERTSQ